MTTANVSKNRLSARAAFLTAQQLPWTHALRHQYDIKPPLFKKKKKTQYKEFAQN